MTGNLLKESVFKLQPTVEAGEFCGADSGLLWKYIASSATRRAQLRGWIELRLSKRLEETRAVGTGLLTICAGFPTGQMSSKVVPVTP